MTTNSNQHPQSPRYAAARKILVERPLTLWRSVERHAMPPDTPDVLRDVLQHIHHMDRRWKAIQRGCERPTIDLAMAELHPQRPVRGNLLDLAMTATLVHALEGSLACAGVLVHGYVVALRNDEAAMRLVISWDLAPIFGVVRGVHPARMGDLLGLPVQPAPPPPRARRDHLTLVIDNDPGVTGRENHGEDGGQAR